MIKETISRDVRTDLLYKEYVFDTRVESGSLPETCAAGSKATCIEDGRIYLLNGAGVWIEQSAPSNFLFPAEEIAEIMTHFPKNTAQYTESAKVLIARPACPAKYHKVSIINPSIDSALTVKLWNRRTFIEGGTARAIETGTAQAVTGTAQAGDATHITLAAGSSASNDFYNNKVLTITGGTGIGQTRVISDYVGASKIALVDAWETTPDATSVYLITEADTGVMLAAASSAVDGYYNLAVIRITAGTGIGQSRTITDYTGTTKTAIVDAAWDVLPDGTSVYLITVDETHIDLGVRANPANDYYNGFVITIISGTGEGQSRTITDYTGGTVNAAEVGAAWDILPDGTSAYTIEIIRDCLAWTWAAIAKAALTAPIVLAQDSTIFQGIFDGGAEVYYTVSNDAAIPNADASRFTTIAKLIPII